jgi:MFS family permease
VIQNRLPLLQLVLVYLAGVLAAAALGKVAPVVPLLQAELGLSLTTAGWAASAITAVPAVLGVVAGSWVDRAGSSRLLLGGLVLLAVSGAAGGLAWGAQALLFTRLFEGFGYLLVVVAGPAFIMHSTAGADRSSALAVWGTFIPVGLAVGSGAGGLIAAAGGWRIWFGCLGAGLLVLAGTMALSGPGPRRTPRPASDSRPTGITAVICLSAGFCLISMISVAVLTLLPTFWSTRADLPPATAGLATALVASASVPGSVLAGWLLRRVPGIPVLGPTAILLPVAALLVFARPHLPGLSIGAAAALLVVNGVLVAVAFAAIPELVDHPSRIGLANGLLAQLGSCGSLFGPPMVAQVVVTYGWGAVAVATAAAAVLGLALFMTADRRAHATT